jgi:hypothetical protein
MTIETLRFRAVSPTVLLDLGPYYILESAAEQRVINGAGERVTP